MSSVPYLKFAGPLLDEATIAGAADVLRSGWITSGPRVQEFERALSAFCAGRPVKALTSATAAVEVALQLAGIGPGDEVITSAQSFFTVLNMIVKVGATPVFVDCDLVTRNIDLGQVEAAITPRTRAIVPTHWPGAPAVLNLRHGPVSRIGLSVPHGGVTLLVVFPVELAILLARSELLIGQVVLVVARPDATRRTKVRDARFRGNPRAGEHYYLPGIMDQPGDAPYRIVHYSVPPMLQFRCRFL